MAKVILFKRHAGVHTMIKEIEIEGARCRYARMKDCNDNYIINEERLLKAIPDKWLPCSPDKIILAVSTKYGSSGQIGLSKFRNWAKYFDCYSIELSN